MTKHRVNLEQANATSKEDLYGQEGSTGDVPKRWKEVRDVSGGVFLIANPDYCKTVSDFVVMRSQDTILTDDDIRAVLLSSGFTVKEGQRDLKPYVFTAIRRIEQLILSRVKKTA